jgi:hypothetical protein
MAKSIFQDLVTKYFPATAKYFYAKINGSKEEPKYLHDEMLDEEYSDDMTYASISGNFTRVTADVVAFDSPAPIKSRGSLKTATGDIPKMAIKYVLNEKQMNTLINLSNKAGRIGEFIKKIFNDTESVIYGIKEKIEQAHLLGFSGGITLIEDALNVGTGIRINYNIPLSNQFGSVIKWSSPTSTPIDDIKRVLKDAKSKGEYPDTIWMDSDILDNILNNDQVKQLFAFSLNFVGTNVPSLSEDQVRDVLKRNFKLNLRIVDRTFYHEKDGKRTTSKGWTPNMVVFTSGVKVGALVYSKLAESIYKQEGVIYAEPNSYILVKKDGTTDPVSERTAAEALVIPVLQNVESLFYLNTEEAAADVQTEGDANFLYETVSYTKASVASALKLAYPATKLTVASTDAALLTAINKLSEEAILVFEANIVASV